MSLVERAHLFGGHPAYTTESTMVRIPAARAVEFLWQEIELGNTINFAECLYLYAHGGTEPSMELSRDRADFESDAAMVSFVEQAAVTAQRRAAEKRASAYFEIDVV